MDWEPLIREARSAQRNAYCPYSGYAVGAALLDDSARVFVGCNVENVSFGATLCAERCAIGKMVSEGGKSVRQIAIATSDGGMPCGICLQVMLEFNHPNQETQIAVAGENTVRYFTISEMLPHSFSTFRAGRD